MLDKHSVLEQHDSTCQVAQNMNFGSHATALTNQIKSFLEPCNLILFVLMVRQTFRFAGPHGSLCGNSGTPGGPLHDDLASCHKAI